MGDHKVAILQSNYIPWKGYFDLINFVDEFIIYDEMQYTKRDWRNRNYIKTQKGVQLLTVPVKTKGRYYQKISEAEINGDRWVKKQWSSIVQAYKHTIHFMDVCQVIRPILRHGHTNLSAMNKHLTTAICRYLGINTRISCSSNFEICEGKTERLVSICKQAGATHYLSGESAKDYIDESLFEEAGIEVEWMSYDGYPEYPQMWGEFDHHVSILDLLFNCGKNSPKYMKSFKCTDSKTD